MKIKTKFSAMSFILVLSFVLGIGQYSTVFAEQVSCTVKGTDFLESNEGFSKYNDMAVIKKASESDIGFTLDIANKKECEYVLKFVAAAATSYVVNLSKVTLSIDGAEPLSLEEDFDYELSEEDRMYTKSSFTAKDNITFSEGVHTFTFTGAPQNGGVRFGIDTVTVEEYAEPLPEGIIVAGNTKIEVEEVSESANIISNSNTSGGKAWIAFGTDSEETIEFPFYVPEKGIYNMNMSGACSAAGSWLSPISYKIDDGGKKEIDGSFASIEAPQLGGNYSDLKMSIYRCVSGVELEKGYHKVTFFITNRTQDGGGVYGAIDYIEFRKSLDFSTFNIGSESDYIEIGKSIPLGLYSGGEEADERDLFTALEYNVVQKDIAEVKDGLMYGLNYGPATATLQIKSNDEVYNFSSDFYVTDKNGLAVKAVTKSGNNITVTVKAFKDYIAEDYIKIYVYGAEEDKLHSVKNEYTIRLSNMTQGEEKEYVQAVEAKAGDKINAVLYNDASEYVSVYAQCFAD